MDITSLVCVRYHRNLASASCRIPTLLPRLFTEAFCCPGGFSSACIPNNARPPGGDVFLGCETYITNPVEVLQTKPAGMTTMSSFKAHDRGYRVQWIDLQTPYFTPTDTFNIRESSSQFPVVPETQKAEFCDSSGPIDNGPRPSHDNVNTALVGGIVGGVLGAILLALGLGCVWMRLRKRNRNQRNNNHISDSRGIVECEGVPEVDGAPSNRTELSGKDHLVSEADAGLTQELPGDATIHELDTCE